MTKNIQQSLPLRLAFDVMMYVLYYDIRFHAMTYLAQDLNIKRMYELYLTKCKDENITPVKATKYRQIFCEDFNISFFKPKKYQCAQPVLHEMNKDFGGANRQIKKSFQEHQMRKAAARKEKKKDKRRAQSNPTYHVDTFYLQAILTTPCSLVGES